MHIVTTKPCLSHQKPDIAVGSLALLGSDWASYSDLWYLWLWVETSSC